MAKGKIWIGTSNVVVPGNKTTFPKEYQHRSRLHYYSQLFNSLEINSSFYKIPQGSTFGKWNDDVVDDFTFSIKLIKDVTHHKSLQRDDTLILRFLDAASQMQKKGCLLIQFPGKITLDFYAQVEDILEELDAADPGRCWRRAVEFRSTSWYVGETEDMLRHYNATMVLHDIPKSRRILPPDNAPFIYLRYHGPTGNYRDSYSDEFLKQQAKNIKVWSGKGKDVFAYFNNTMGSAFDNARLLRKLVRE